MASNLAPCKTMLTEGICCQPQIFLDKISDFRFVTVKNPHDVLLLLFVQDDDYRIFFLNSYSAIARRIICEVR